MPHNPRSAARSSNDSPGNKKPNNNQEMAEQIVWTQSAQVEFYTWDSFGRVIKEVYIRTAERFLISFFVLWLVFTFSVFNFPFYQRLAGHGHASHTLLSVCDL